MFTIKEKFKVFDLLRPIACDNYFEVLTESVLICRLVVVEYICFAGINKIS